MPQEKRSGRQRRTVTQAARPPRRHRGAETAFNDEHAQPVADVPASDLGWHDLTQQYCAQSLAVATSAGSRAYAANVLPHRSRLTPSPGQSGTADDRAPHAAAGPLVPSSRHVRAPHEELTCFLPDRTRCAAEEPR